jgi:hypothetical protein
MGIDRIHFHHLIVHSSQETPNGVTLLKKNDCQGWP